ncbi:hypothetical protein OG762_18495 [Streptomyces sp. NBC_01136]|uniref:hypothetical protein n=1 Tax=Streptomyces sp. NBC_01136 TaxID=2903754 RepID=UPI003867E2DA|nr:hypothetical protein OG762_18495 [Streptomyces sp. NBC_01136]
MRTPDADDATNAAEPGEALSVEIGRSVQGPPGVVVVGRDDTVKAASPGVQDWLYECLPAPDDRPTGPPGPPKLDHEALLSSVRNITATARRAPDGTAPSTTTWEPSTASWA